MNRPFRHRGDAIVVKLTTRELSLLRAVPEVLDQLDSAPEDPAYARLHLPAHPDDPEAEEQYHDLVADDLERMRRADRARFTATLGGESLDFEDAQAWMRVLGDARLVLAVRMGIEDESWDDDRALAESREGVMLQYLGYLQDSLVRVLTTAL